MRTSISESPYAVIRHFRFGNPNHAEEWYRVVTWSPRSDQRELIGWCQTFEAACNVGWDYHMALTSWQHHLAARRVDMAEANRQRPSAADLVKFYRENRPVAG